MFVVIDNLILYDIKTICDDDKNEVMEESDIREKNRKEYDKVVSLLKNQLISEGVNPNDICIEYRVKGKSIRYVLDLVVMNREKKILKIFEVKTLQSLRVSSGFTLRLLQMYQGELKPISGVYVAYLDENEQIVILSSSQLRDKQFNKSELLTNVTTISSFTEFFNKILDLRITGSSDMTFVYRGHSDATYRLVPSVYRGDFIKSEDIMFHEANRLVSSEFTENMSTFDKLVKMQHYALPTRLLDVTVNPLVALYFACIEKEDNDGVVLVFPLSNKMVEYYDSDSVCILANIAKRPYDFMFSKDKKLLVSDIKQDKFGFDETSLKSDDLNRVVCVMPKLNNERIERQKGAFFIFGIEQKKNDAAKLLDKPIRIVVKSDSKRKILSELELLGIEKSTIFPEIENVMERIKMNMK